MAAGGRSEKPFDRASRRGVEMMLILFTAHSVARRVLTPAILAFKDYVPGFQRGK